jgi:lipopolysaccharide transport system permease protein
MSAVADIGAAIKRYDLVGVLGWADVRQRYRRSSLGPFWITIGMGVMIATIGVVFGQIFKSPLHDFFPFLTIGTIVWTFMSTVLSEGSTGFIAAEAIVKQLPLPLFVHIMRMVWRNLIILAHNIVIFPLVLIVVGKPLELIALMAIPGLVLTVVNLSWMALMLGLLCARYRDLPQIVTSLLQVVFYLTPVIWMPKLLPERAGTYLLDSNPFFHMLEVVRAPLLGQMPSMTNWTVSLALATIGWTVTVVFFGRYRNRVAYWL